MTRTSNIPAGAVKGSPCLYTSTEMENPKTLNSTETFLWFLYHEKSEIYIDQKKSWYLLIKRRCRKLAKGGNCELGEKQFGICSRFLDFPEKSALKEGKEFYFKSENPFLEYLKRYRPALFKKLCRATRRLIP